MKKVKAKRKFNTLNELGECPVYCDINNCFFWIDIIEKKLFCYNFSSNTLEMENLGFSCGSFCITTEGKLIFATDDGILLNYATKDETLIPIPDFDPALERINDGKCDPFGNFLFGSMDRMENKSIGHFYRLSKNLSIEILFDDIVISNGPAFSKDGRFLYFSDSFNQQILRFPYSENSKLEREKCEVFYEFYGTDLAPDGLCVDNNNTLWVSIWGGYKVLGINDKKKIIYEVSVPTKNVTSCTFVKRKNMELFITSARKGLEKVDLKFDQDAGALFSAVIEDTDHTTDTFSLAEKK